MRAWETVRDAVRYMEEHLVGGVEIESLAKNAALSPYDFKQLFRRVAGREVQEHYRLLRLATAVKRADRTEALADIAARCGFHGMEDLASSVRAAYGTTLDAYCVNPAIPQLAFGSHCGDAAAGLGTPQIHDGIVLELQRRRLTAPRRFLGITGHIRLPDRQPDGAPAGIDRPGRLWEMFYKCKGQVPHLLKGGQELGVAYPGAAPPGYFCYFAGAETESMDRCGGFVPWVLHPGDYLVCSFGAESLRELVTVTLKKSVSYCVQWLENNHLTTTDYAAELYYDVTPEGAYMENWVTVVPKTKN